LPRNGAAHHLDRRILEPVAVEKHTPLVGQRGAVNLEALLPSLLSAGVVGRAIDERRLIDEAVPPTDFIDDFRKDVLKNATAGLLRQRFSALLRFLVGRQVDEIFHIEPRVPHLKGTHRGVFPQVLAVGPHA
jgi:hypothetical protein